MTDWCLGWLVVPEAMAGDLGNLIEYNRPAPCTGSCGSCKRLVRETGLGLAPGTAFGPEGEGYVRWCFAASQERLAEGVKRLRKGLTAGA